MRNIILALDEDIGSNLISDSGDITAQLIPETAQAHAKILTREPMVLAGRPWVDALFNKLDQTVKITWLAEEGKYLTANTIFLEISGNAHSLLTGERPALNFIQTLSGVATRVAGTSNSWMVYPLSSLILVKLCLGYASQKNTQ